METGEELAQKATAKALDIAQNLDEKYQLKDKLNTAKEEAQKRAHNLDEKYHVVERVGVAKTTAVMYAGKVKFSLPFFSFLSSFSFSFSFFFERLGD